MINLLYIFLAVALLKFLINFSKFSLGKSYLDKYSHWLDNPNWQFVEHKSQVIKFLKDAGIRDSYQPHVEWLGLGLYTNYHLSTFENFPHRNMHMAAVTTTMFRDAIGVYRSRMLETLNPLYWIEVVINLPKEVLIYLGISSESAIIKVAQVLYWVLAFIFSFLFLLYKPEIETLVRDWISKLTP